MVLDDKKKIHPFHLRKRTLLINPASHRYPRHILKMKKINRDIKYTRCSVSSVVFVRTFAERTRYVGAANFPPTELLLISRRILLEFRVSAANTRLFALQGRRKREEEGRQWANALARSTACHVGAISSPTFNLPGSLGSKLHGAVEHRRRRLNNGIDRTTHFRFY